MEYVIEIERLTKIYRRGDQEVAALQGVDLVVPRGEMLTIVGPSGSGKSTLLNILGCLDRPSGGVYRLAGEDVAAFGSDQLAEVRNRRIGFVFQGFHLLPQLTALDNVELPLLFAGLPTRRRRERAQELLAMVGLDDRMDHRPTELSGGQMQRVAIARALACDPDIVLADEPTGNLDSSSGRDVLHVFEELRDAGRTLIVITHDPAVARRGERVVTIQDGRIVGDEAIAA